MLYLVHMDTLSHGLWGGIAFGRKRRLDFWIAFLFGVLPDILSFGVFISGSWLGIFDHPDFSSGKHPDPSEIPAFVHISYDITHSLVIFLLVLAAVLLIRKKIYWPMFAWPLHILYDIPTHSSEFFPTPFLWPVSDFHVNGIAWSNPVIFIPNVVLLTISLLWLFFRKIEKTGL